MAGILGQLNGSIHDIASLSGETASDLGTARDLLTRSADQLDAGKAKLDSVLKEVEKAAASGDMAEIETLLSGSPAELSSFLAAPVELKTEKIYPVANYGSAMAPFYTTPVSYTHLDVYKRQVYRSEPPKTTARVPSAIRSRLRIEFRLLPRAAPSITPAAVI